MQDNKVKSLLANIMTSLTGIVKTCDSELTQQASQTTSQQKTQRKGRKKSTSRMLFVHEEGQAAEQPPVGADKASDAELLRIAFTDGEAAINTSRPLQQGHARYPGSAIASRSGHAVRNLLLDTPSGMMLVRQQACKQGLLIVLTKFGLCAPHPHQYTRGNRRLEQTFSRQGSSLAASVVAGCSLICCNAIAQRTLKWPVSTG